MRRLDPVTWVDWVLLGLTYLLCAVAVLLVIGVVRSLAKDERERAAVRQDQIHRFLTMLTEIRLMLAVWNERPRA